MNWYSRGSTGAIIVAFLFLISTKASAALITVDLVGVINEYTDNASGRLIDFSLGDTISRTLIIDTAYAPIDTSSSSTQGSYQLNSSSGVVPYVTGGFPEPISWTNDNVGVQDHNGSTPHDTYWVSDRGSSQVDYAGTGNYFVTHTGLDIQAQSSLVNFILGDGISQNFKITNADILGLGDSQAVMWGNIWSKENLYENNQHVSESYAWYQFELQQLTVSTNTAPLLQRPLLNQQHSAYSA